MNKATITILAVAFSLAIHFMLFYNYEKEDIDFTKQKTQQPNQVKVTFTQTTPKPLPKPIKKKIIKNVVKKVAKKKEIIKENKPVAVVKPTIVATSTKQKKDNSEELKAKQNLFLALIKETINKNKRYPKVAIRRGIEGFVEIEFKLLRNGQVISVNILNGKKIFYKATKKAISKSFPISIPNKLKESFPMTFKLKVIYNLHN